MPVTIAPPEIAIEPRRSHGGPNGGDRWGGDDAGGRGDSNGRNFETSPQAYHLGMMLGLASVLMLFVALSSAYVMREGQGQDWLPIAMPPLLLPNTFALLLSSLTLELSRRSLRRQSVGSFQGWLTVSALLGLIFLVGQLMIWRALTAQGIYLGSNPHSSFYYLLSGAHAVHMIGGLIA